ncbi:MAG: hypothetical protein FD127_1455 [Acidimicrobiaceae bacterium]|nr:MAG: hypothetical protein FD127_1455 [Acidimicrobiaceae bacterium]
MTSNRLAQETSPYLRQHKDNPVDWYAWGPEAFAEAERGNRPILLSVGYSACHWCHVMAHECFEDAEVAAAMNRLFVNVKVDREERPDVDSIYMDAVQAMTGRGGWPMTVFMTPDRKPFYGGTYFPKQQFLKLMEAIDDVWRNRPSDVHQNVAALLDAVDRTSKLTPMASVPGASTIDAAVAELDASFDPEWGGFGSAPKFPSTMSLDLLLRAHLRAPSDRLRSIVETSLGAMASGGMYDHIGGGFARYSVDEKWLVPHFEKMLYDQALLVRVYAHAALVFDDAVWRQVVEETIGYVLTELRHRDGGFFSAEDADSPDEHGHGHEGLFYVWTEAEVRDVLGADAEAALDWYEFTHPANAEGNFEGRMIPCRMHHRRAMLRPPQVERARVALLERRASRARPGLDDKVLTEWNALMLASLAEAAAAFGPDDWMVAAIAAGEFLVRELRGSDGRWFRSWQADGNPRARHAALAADHAALVDAFTRLAEASGEARWIGHATDVADTMLDHFWDTDNGGLFTTADDAEALIVRQKDLMDNATPSANSVAAVALVRLAALTGEPRYANHARQILLLLARVMPQAPTAFSNALVAVDLEVNGVVEVAVAGDRPDLLAVIRESWRPQVVVAWGERFDSPLWSQRSDGLAYVCENFSCRRPTAEPDVLRAQLAETVTKR